MDQALHDDAAFVSDLIDRGVVFWVDAGQLKFSAPEGVVTPHLRSALAARKAAIMGMLSGADRILPCVRTASLPLSFAQQGIWFVQQLGDLQGMFNLTAALALEGALDRRALQLAVNQTVQQHEVLRTRFHACDGAVQATILPSCAVPVSEVDCSAGSENAQLGLEALIQRDAAAEFDLSKAPLIRATLLAVDADHCVLLLVVHHIAADALSLQLILLEIAQRYAHAVTGRAAVPPAEQLQYVDYAVWQAQQLTAQQVAAQLQYWRSKLQGAPVTHSLPLDRPRRLVQRRQGASCERAIPAALLAQLHGLAAESQTTLFVVLHSALALLVARLGRENDVVIGSPISSRVHTDLRHMVGVFVNMLALRTRVQDGMDFRQLLASVKATVLEAFEHQALPFERLVQELSPTRALGHHPLFQICLALQEFGVGAAVDERQMHAVLADAGLQVQLLAAPSEASFGDLAIFAWPRAGELILSWRYNMELFDAATVAAMTDAFITLLEQAVQRPQAGVHTLSLLGAQQAGRLSSLWHAARAEFPRQCAHELFEAKAAQRPHAVAVVHLQQELTYAELNQRANQLARLLCEQGVGAEVPVGLCLQRGFDMLIGLLAILKAGGTYVPLDPDLPAARLQYMIADCRTPLVLCESSLHERLAAETPASVRLIPLDAREVRELAGRQHAGNLPQRGLRPQHLAYIIYTSGTTGTPKGVMVSHRSLVNFLHWRHVFFELSERDVLMQKASLAFDISVGEILVALCGGGRLIVARAGGHRDPDYLADLIMTEGISLIAFVPAMLRTMLAQPAWITQGKVKRITCGGEALAPDLVEAVLGGTRSELINLYGPTEATIAASFWRCTRESSRHTTPIGSAIHNCELYVLDAALQPVPFGLVGELFIGGECVTRGYLHAPALTARGFVPNPFSGVAGSRMYRTGDLVRYLPDGELVFLGRLDNQVKVRGFRIEVAEIESKLRELDVIRDCVVSTFRDASNETALAAYLVVDAAAIDAAASKDIQESEFVARRLGRLPASARTAGSGESLLILGPAALQEREDAAVCISPLQWSKLAAERRFTRIIMEAVSESYPSLEFLEGVLRKALARVADGGSVFIPAVCSLELLPQRLLQQLQARTDLERTPQQLAQQLRLETQRCALLCIAAAWFQDFVARATGCASALHLSLTLESTDALGRYDVEIWPTPAPTATCSVTPVPFAGHGLADLLSLTARLQEPVTLITGIPDARLLGLTRQLAAAEGSLPGSEAAEPGLDPLETLHALRQQGRDARLLWNPDAPQRCFDCMLADAEVLPRRFAAATPRAQTALATRPTRAEWCESLADRCRQHLRASLPSYMIPASFALIDAVPVNVSGKVDRAALPATVAMRLAERYEAPRTQLESDLCRVWAEVLQVERVGIADNFFELGGTSLLLLQLVSAMRELNGRELTVAALLLHPTVEEFAAYLERNESYRWSPLITFNKAGVRIPIFCVPGAEIIPTYLSHFAAELGRDQPFYGLMMRGADGMSEPLDSIEAVAADHVAALLAVRPEGPYVLAGHSMGGTIAYEIARQLLARGKSVLRLAILDGLPVRPELPERHFSRRVGAWLNSLLGRKPAAQVSDLTLLLNLIESVERMFACELGVEPMDIARLSPADALAEVHARLQRAGHAHLTLAQLQTLFAMLRNSVQLILTYAPPLQHIPVPISVFKPRQGWNAPELGEDLGWSDYTSAPVEVHTVSGDHMSMMRGSGAREVARALKSQLQGIRQ